MKQSEYLRELKENLELRVSTEELRDILSDYESFFISGREEGKSDDEISGELGSPAFLAKTLQEEHSGKEAGPTNIPIANPGRRLCGYFIDAVIAIMPALITCFIIGRTLALPFLLFLTAPSPVAGASVYMGYSAFTEYSASGVVTYVTKEDGTKADNEIYTGSGTETGVQGYWTDDKKPGPTISILAGVSLIFYLFYSLVCTLIFKGQTAGKKLMGIKIRRSNAEPAAIGVIFAREFLGKIVINSVPIIPLISFFTILFTEEHKALHDMLAGTIVTDV